MTVKTKDQLINQVLSEYAHSNNISANIRIYQGNIFIGNKPVNYEQEEEIVNFIIKGRRVA